MEQETEVRPARAERHDDDLPRRNRHVGFFVVLVLFLVVVGVVGWAGNRYRTCRTAPVADGQTVTVQVPKGATGDDVVQLLADKGLINCGGFLGNLLLRGTGRSGDTIYAGTYDLRMGMSLDRILTVLTTKPVPVPTVELTVPEGLRIASTYPGEDSVASSVQKQTSITAKEFARVAQSGKFRLPFMPKGVKTTEGFLFPNTYQLVKKGLTPQTIVKTMLHQFTVEAKKIHLVEGAKRLGISPYQVVIVASMIEREARTEHDRPLIASVIYNRLKRGMTLGIDATLLYDDPTPDGKLSTADLKTRTPYNTRINAGLPPTPIASPGEASLLAALHPADTHYLYYVLCGADGSHKFATTLHQHNINVQQCPG
jgi:UPF0755 protein